MTVRDIERKFINDSFIVVDNRTGDILFNSVEGTWQQYKAIRDLDVTGMCIENNTLILGVWR